MSLFKRKKEVKQEVKGDKLTAFDKVVYKLVNKNGDDDSLYDVADTVLGGRPVLIKFENSVDDANRMLAFLSGICYASSGRVIPVSSHLFLLARKEELEDGTLYQYVEAVK